MTKRPYKAHPPKDYDSREFKHGGSKDPPKPVITQAVPEPCAKRMCKECPLARKSAPGYLGGYTAVQYIGVLHSDFWIACHLSPGFQERDISKQRGCTGVAHYRANVSKLPRSPSAMEDVRKVGKNTEDVFSTPMGFYEHHKSAKGANE